MPIFVAARRDQRNHVLPQFILVRDQVPRTAKAEFLFDLQNPRDEIEALLRLHIMRQDETGVVAGRVQRRLDEPPRRRVLADAVDQFRPDEIRPDLDSAVPWTVAATTAATAAAPV